MLVLRSDWCLWHDISFARVWWTVIWITSLWSQSSSGVVNINPTSRQHLPEAISWPIHFQHFQSWSHHMSFWIYLLQGHTAFLNEVASEGSKFEAWVCVFYASSSSFAQLSTVSEILGPQVPFSTPFYSYHYHHNLNCHHLFSKKLWNLVIF